MSMNKEASTTKRNSSSISTGNDGNSNQMGSQGKAKAQGSSNFIEMCEKNDMKYQKCQKFEEAEQSSRNLHTDGRQSEIDLKADQFQISDCVNSKPAEIKTERNLSNLGFLLFANIFFIFFTFLMVFSVTGNDHSTMIFRACWIISSVYSMHRFASPFLLEMISIIVSSNSTVAFKQIFKEKKRNKGRFQSFQSKQIYYQPPKSKDITGQVNLNIFKKYNLCSFTQKCVFKDQRSRENFQKSQNNFKTKYNNTFLDPFFFVQTDYPRTFTFTTNQVPTKLGWKIKLAYYLSFAFFIPFFLGVYIEYFLISRCQIVLVKQLEFEEEVAFQ